MSTFESILPASLRPNRTHEQESLLSILGRIHTERGHFRNITEDGLRTEIAAEQEREREDVSEDEDDTEQDAKASSSRQEQLQAAKAEMIGHIASAQNEALTALDFVSLLVSKDLPHQGNLTMSPFLKAQLKPGTLGLDMWQNMPSDTEREVSDSLLAKGSKMKLLQHSADSLLDAASRLEGTVRRETEYWNQVLTVSERGWPVCRVPRERNTLGVRFGFSEAQGEFRHRGLAALRADADGQVTLGRGFGDNPKAIRVRIFTDSKQFASSDSSSLEDEGETTIEARIRRARDSLYEEELFYEMMRESRSLTGYEVNMEGMTIKLPFMKVGGSGATSCLHIDLVPVGGGKESPPQDSRQGELAQSVALGLRLLLSHLHRQRLQQRSQIPTPLSMKKTEEKQSSILRPFLTAITHQASLNALSAYLDGMQELFRTASMELSFQAPSAPLSAYIAAQNIQGLMQAMLSPCKSAGSITLAIPGSGPVALSIAIVTLLEAPNYGSSFMVTAPYQPREVQCSSIDALKRHLEYVLSLSLARGVHDKLSGWRMDEREAIIRPPLLASSTVGSVDIELVDRVESINEKRSSLNTFLANTFVARSRNVSVLLSVA